MTRRYGPRWLAARACALVSLFCYSIAAPAGAWVVEGRVVGVSDGDTMIVLDRANVQRKIRLAGIDAPEKGQALGGNHPARLSAVMS